MLVQLRAPVPFPKHDPNAQSLGTLAGEVRKTDAGVASSVERMQGSIRKAGAFLTAFE